MSPTKTLCKLPFFVVSDREGPGCPPIWVGTSRDQKNQDAVDHDKGQKSAISGRRVHWIFLNFLQWIFAFFSRFSVQLSYGNGPKKWRKLPDFRAEKKAQNPVTSLAVMVSSVPKKKKTLCKRTLG